ncbi:MAG: sulfurtransferase [Gemmatimonadota bacterium]|nr:MAG: sulfurtransferase [Gemmatimonadota bacterium]
MNKPGFRITIAAILIFSCISISTVSGKSPVESMFVTTQWLEEHLADPSLLLLHVGRKEGYDKEHIPGARIFSLLEVVVNSPNGLFHERPPIAKLDSVLKSAGVSDTSRIVVYYAESRGISLATRLLLTLDYAGLGDSTSMLQGGFPRWKAENRKLTAELPEALTGNYTPRPNADVFVDGKWINDNIRNPNIVIIDARPEEVYTGIERDSHSKRRGHIAGAFNIPFFELMTEDSPSQLKDAAELAEIFSDNGAKPGSVLVIYCGTGIWASPVYFAAKYLGYDVRFYDGSFQEWTGDKTLPVIEPVKIRPYQ